LSPTHLSPAKVKATDRQSSNRQCTNRNGAERQRPHRRRAKGNRSLASDDRCAILLPSYRAIMGCFRLSVAAHVPPSGMGS
jgi:hypothetical protein